jgi:hypothetical protein
LNRKNNQTKKAKPIKDNYPSKLPPKLKLNLTFCIAGNAVHAGTHFGFIGKISLGKAEPTFQIGRESLLMFANMTELD